MSKLTFEQNAELFNIWKVAKGISSLSRQKKLLYTIDTFVKVYPEISRSFAYKILLGEV